MTRLLTALALFACVSVHATELDPATAPNEIIVREDAHGNREIFKVNSHVNVNDKASAAEAIENFVVADNKVTSVVRHGELDRTSSTEAWYFWNNWYGCNWGGYPVYYQQYYSWNYGFYNYFWYRWF